MRRENENTSLKNPIFDQKGYLFRLEDDYEIAQSTLQLFLDDVPQKIAFLRNSIETDDIPALISNSHSLKGNSLTVGAERLQESALQFEMAARTEKRSELSRLLQRIESDYTEFKEFVEKIRFLPE